jgi:phosphoribosylformylglycinamidine synthase
MSTLDFKHAGDKIYVIGEITDDLGCSEYLHFVKGVRHSPAPYFDLDKEQALHGCIRACIAQRVVASTHDVAEGGVMIALMESCFPQEKGFTVVAGSKVRQDAFYFGEGQGRIVVSVTANQITAFEKLCASFGVPALPVGEVTEGKVSVEGQDFGNISGWKEIYRNVLRTYLDN